jgi:hypothetical protein
MSITLFINKNANKVSQNFTEFQARRPRKFHFTMDLPNLNSWKVTELKDFLRQRGRQLTGNKATLIGLVKLYSAEHADIRIIDEAQECSKVLEKKLDDHRKLFDVSSLVWKDVQEIKTSDIPSDFDSLKINKFLTTLVLHVGDDIIDAGTQKPAKKGRRMYSSKKIQLCEFATNTTQLLFRATMEASMARDKVR